MPSKLSLRTKAQWIALFPSTNAVLRRKCCLQHELDPPSQTVEGQEPVTTNVILSHYIYLPEGRTHSHAYGMASTNQ